MPSRKITLLDRAKADLVTAKSMMSVAINDDVVMDVCAYHCQQCVEKITKFLILLQGDNYANDHRSDIYLEELKDDEVAAIVRHVASKIDSWATTIRYHHAILSNEKMVKEVVEICEKLVIIAEKRIPGEARSPASDVKNLDINNDEIKDK